MCSWRIACMGLSLLSERFASSPFPILIAERPSRQRPSKVGLTIRGEPAGRHEPRAACLYSVGQRDPNHDAVIRIGSLAPRWGTILSSAVMPCDTAGAPPLPALRGGGGAGPPPP